MPTTEIQDSRLPIEFLSNYAFPGFIFRLPIPVASLDCGTATHPDYQPLCPIWQNKSFDSLSAGRSLTEMLQQPALSAFEDWVSGAADHDVMKERKRSDEAEEDDLPMEKNKSSSAGEEEMLDDAIEPSTFIATIQPRSGSRRSASIVEMTRTAQSAGLGHMTTLFVIVQCIPRKLGGTWADRKHGHLTEDPLTPSLINDATPQGTVTRNPFPFYSSSEGQPESTSTEVLSDGSNTLQISETSTPGGVPPTPEHISLGYSPSDESLVSGHQAPSDKLSIEYLLQNTDWAKTSLGPRQQWSQALRTMLCIVQSLPMQAAVWWTDDLRLLYNNHYAVILKGKHPKTFGMAGAEAYAEVWDTLGPLAESVKAGVPVCNDDDEYLLASDIPETPLVETFHSWVWIPVFDTDFGPSDDKHDPRKFLGLFNFTRDTTRKVIAARRLRAIRDVSDNLQAARNLEEYNSAVMDGLGTEEIAKDVPFAIFYQVDKDEKVNNAGNATNLTSEDRSATGVNGSSAVSLNLTLGGTLGVPLNHAAATPHVNISIKRPMQRLGGLDPGRTSSPTLSMISNISSAIDEAGQLTKAVRWPFKEVLQGRKAVVVEDCSDLIQGFVPRSWGHLPNSAVLLPICNDSNSDIPSGVLILGLNLRRVYDVEYSEWHHQLQLSCMGGLLQVRSVEAERQRTDDLKAMDELKTNWISNVSHELRLPLTLISGPIDDLLVESRGDTRVKDLLTIAKRNVGRLHRLVDQLIDFSRIEGGSYKMACRAMPISSYTKDLACLFRSAIERTKLKYYVDCEEDRGRSCFVDPDMYEKVALNLIGNGFKYTSTGFVKVALKYTHTHAVLTVSDSGVGIPRMYVNRIGERFFRVAAQSRSHEGTGIGLSLTKELIRLMGGTLSLESWVAEENNEGKHGSIFTAKFPLGFMHLPPSAMEDVGPLPSMNGQRKLAQGLVEEALQWNRDTESSGENSSESGRSMRLTANDRSASTLDPSTWFFDENDIILIVDDSKDLRAYLSSILRSYVKTVIEAEDGIIGLEKARKYRPHLIISDVQMPNMDGFGLLNAVKKDEHLKWTPMILLTARAGEGETVEGLLTGAEDYMTKPFQSRELVARASLQVQLGKRRAILEQAFALRLEEVESRRMAAEMERKRQELLIDVTSHELRNPTSAIIQCSEMVLSDLVAIKQSAQSALEQNTSLPVTEALIQQLSTNEDLCQNINFCAQSQSRIADDVLALAKINLDKMRFNETVTNIKSRVTALVAPFQIEAKAKEIDLVLDITDEYLEPVPVVFTDGFRLGQVLVNLVSNALRYASDGPIKSVITKLTMRSEPPADLSCVPPNVPFAEKMTEGDLLYLYVAVTDSGPGLAKDDVKLLFKRFSQATTSQSNKSFGGSGLGLWISKQIVTQMGGRIEVDSELGHGCTFRFYVPVRAHQLDRSPKYIAPEVKPKRKIEKVSARVLVVEDNLINQKILVMQLRKSGITTEAVDHGRAAVDRLMTVCAVDPVSQDDKDKSFDLVLMDLEMPVMGGLEAIKIIREEEASGKLRRSYVVALTGNARQQQIEEAIQCGMDAVLVKPYNLSDILNYVKSRVDAAA